MEDALHRELGEEIGIVPVSYDALASVVDRGPRERGQATYHLYLVRAWTGGEPAMRDNEHTELAWFTIEDACALPDLALADYANVFRLAA